MAIRSFLVAAIAAVLQLGALPAAVAEPVVSRGASMPAGLRFAAMGACQGSFQVGNTNLCSHGPDPIPQWIRERGGPKIERQTSALETATAAVGCDGDGVSGKRVQAIYAYVSGRPDRLSTYRLSMRSWAADVDAMFARSARETGGTARLRWVTVNCQLDILPVALSSSAEVAFDVMLAELAALGHNRDDRKYLVWFDSNPSVWNMCGLGTIWQDDRASMDNFNNQFVGYARADYYCWDFTESHELMHTLGGVQLTSPHTSGQWHCVDENDQMCYPDGPDVVMTYPCPEAASSNIFDCGHDDYFHTSPEAGSYLRDHWNAARSDWVVGGEEPVALPGDGIAPVAERPAVSFVAPQTMSTTALVRVQWPEVSDSSGITAYELQRRKGAGSWRTIALPTTLATSVDVPLVVGARYAFRLRARDGAGNIGPWAVAPAATLRLLEETSTAITYVDPFRRVALSGASARYVRKSGVSGRLARLTFNGTSVALLSTTGPARGIAHVRVDGGAWQPVDLYGAAMSRKQVVWSAAVGDGAHTLELSVAGERNPSATSSRVDIDAFLVR